MVAFEQTAGLEPSYPRRLAALAVRIAEDEERIGDRLRLSNDDRDTIRQAVAGSGQHRPPAEKRARAWLYRALQAGEE
ncbi:MAG: hypothetical protein IH825_08705 [Candidatus Marinimicrobia bacterium]|nr:hypothetical protein [Candidatus Neomarinimicrobiota bacterium]